MANHSKDRRRAITFRPGLDTAIAGATLIAMTGIYYANATYGYDYPIVFFGGFVLIGHLLLNTLIPALTVLVLNKGSLADLGITKDRIWLSLALSVGLGAMMYPQLRAVLEVSSSDPAPNIAFNAIAFWEPLFVYGWLQLRFERAFGYLLAPVLAGGYRDIQI